MSDYSSAREEAQEIANFNEEAAVVVKYKGTHLYKALLAKGAEAFIRSDANIVLKVSPLKPAIEKETQTMNTLRLTDDRQYDEQEYNGWINRETWAMYSHLTSDEVFRSYWLLCAEKTLQDVTDDPEVLPSVEPFHPACGQLAGYLKQEIWSWFEDIFYPCPDSSPSKEVLLMAADVGSLWRVDWNAVARMLMQEVAPPPIDRDLRR